MSTKVEQRLQWRRDKVRELSVKGYNLLKVGLASVNEDLQFLRNAAKANISKYIEEYLPAEYENCLDGLNDILQEAWIISKGVDSDNRGRIYALTLAKKCYGMKLDLLSSASVIDRAVKFVGRHRGLILQNDELVKDNDAAELIENTG